MTLLHRIWSICSNLQLFHIEVEKLKTILQKNMYPIKMIENCVRLFQNKIHKPKLQDDGNEEIKVVRLVLPFLGKQSLELKKVLLKCVSKNLPKGFKLNIVFRSQTTISQFFKFKDSLPKHLLSHIIYKFTCDRCNSVYHGLTQRHIKVRWCEHLGLSPYTSKSIVGVKSEIRDHSVKCGENAKWENFRIVARDDNPFNLKIKESLLIKRENSILNKDLYSTPLYLF